MAATKKCLVVGCVFAAQYKVVITAPLVLARSGDAIAPGSWISEDGVCDRCRYVLKIGDYVSREKWKEMNWQVTRRGMRADWQQAQLHVHIPLSFTGVIDGKFHRDDLEFLIARSEGRLIV